MDDPAMPRRGQPVALDRDSEKRFSTGMNGRRDRRRLMPMPAPIQCADLFSTITKAKWGKPHPNARQWQIRYSCAPHRRRPWERTRSDLERVHLEGLVHPPDGGYLWPAKADHPDSNSSIEGRGPDLGKPLKKWVKQRHLAGPKRWQALTDDLREGIGGLEKATSTK